MLTDKGELAELIRHVENIADKWGIEKSLERKWLKPEDNAHRFVLPIEFQNSANSEFGIRLYCVLLSDNVLMILNGDIKTAQWVRDCKRCEPHFDFANKVAIAIARDLNRGAIEIDNEGLLVEEDYTLYIKD